MNDSNHNWSKNELQAYMLLYCAHADFSVTEDEVEMITSKVNASDYKAISKEFNADNDFQSLQKIQQAISKLELSESQIESLIEETKALFLADGAFDAAEKALFAGLKKLIR